MRHGEWVRFVIRFEVLDLERCREMTAAVGTRRYVGAPTTWWGAPIAAVTDAT